MEYGSNAEGTYVTNSPVIVEAITTELEGKRFVAFNIYYNGLAKGSRIFEVENNTDILLKIVDEVSREGALGADIVTNSEEVLAAFFNIPHYNVTTNLDERIYKPLLNYFDPNTNEFKLTQETYLSDEPEVTASELENIDEKPLSFMARKWREMRVKVRRSIGSYLARLIDEAKHEESRPNTTNEGAR